MADISRTLSFSLPVCGLSKPLSHIARRWARLYFDSSQWLSPLIIINQSQHRKRAVRVVSQTSVTYPCKAPNALKREEGVFDFYTRLAFGAIGLFIPLSQGRVAVGALVSEVFGA